MKIGYRVLRLWPWLAAVASGLAYAMCFPPFDQAWLCWLVLVPLLAAVWFGPETKRPSLRDFFVGYLSGVTFFWTVFSWLTTVTTPGWILVGLYMGIYPAIWAWIAGRLRPTARKPKPLAGLEAVTKRLEEKRATERATLARVDVQASDELAKSNLGSEGTRVVSPWLGSYSNLRVAVLLAAAWVTLETIRAHLFSGWGWNTLGHALHAQWAMIQIVEFTGVPGLSFLVCLTNVVLLATARRFIAESEAKQRRPHFEFTLTMAAIVGVLSYGVRAVQERGETTSVRIAALQPNIPREEKFNPTTVQDTFATFSRLSQTALQAQPELLVWPESAMPGPIMQDEASYRFVMDFTASAKTDLLLGAIDQDEKAAYNAALLVSDGGQKTQLYRKIHLVPFGEYVPGRNTIPGIARIVGDQVPEDFGFGSQYTVFKMTRGDVKLAPLICFEDTIGELTRQFILPHIDPDSGKMVPGANLLANVTNDGWFLQTAGPRQHLANAIFRCVETRLPMVRSANTGVTCFVNEFGRLTKELPQFGQGVLTGEVRVPIAYEPTFYVRHGELFAQCCAIVTALLLVFLFVQQLILRRR